MNRLEVEIRGIRICGIGFWGTAGVVVVVVVLVIGSIHLAGYAAT